MVTRISRFQAADGKQEELHALLKSVVPHITASAGCESSRLLRNTAKPDEFVVIEAWDTIESHQQSVANFPKEKMQAAMPLLAAPPDGAYYAV